MGKIVSPFWSKIDKLDDEAELVSKLVFSKDNAVAETVLYRYPTFKERTVICCSVQSGCPVGCTFCGTGDFFVRNLTVEEIVSQPTIALDEVFKSSNIKPEDIEKLQIMFMSMGEPMLNMARLIDSIRELHILYPNASLLVSTSAPDVDYQSFFELSKEISQVGLQFSIHESSNETRDKLIPYKRKLDLEQIAQLGEDWARITRRQPFFNYCVHDKNSTENDVERLKKLFDPAVWKATVSVICERDETLKAAHDRQKELVSTFMSKMLDSGYSTRAFSPAGQDSIGGGCGQLFATQRWFKENPEKARPNRRK